MRSSKIFLAVPSLRPDVPGQQRKGEIGCSALAPLKQTRCQIVTTRSGGASFLVMFHFRRNPSGAQFSDETTIIGHFQRIILRWVTRSSPARQKARRTGVEPLVTNSTTLQSSWSTCRSSLPTLGLPCQPMRTFWPAFVPQVHEELTQFFYSSFTPLFPKIITDKCLFRLQHLTMSPSLLFHKQPCVSSGTHHPQSGQDQSKAFERRRHTSISLLPAKSAGAARNFAEPEFLGGKSPKSRPILARSSITSEESQEEHGALPR